VRQKILRILQASTRAASFFAGECTTSTNHLDRGNHAQGIQAAPWPTIGPLARPASRPRWLD
jgi:hypothetical protein